MPPIRGANALETLRKQLNTAYPMRNKLSDGGIGDAAHARSKSEHNPNSKGVFRARDFTHDPRTGIDCNWLAATLIKNKDKRIRYIIWNKRIANARDGFIWRPYTGKNGHTKHLHISVHDDERLYDDASPWKLDFPSNKKADDVARVSLLGNIDPELNEVDEGDISEVIALNDLTPTQEPETQSDGQETPANDLSQPSGAAPGASHTNAELSPQNIVKESPSLFTKVTSSITGFIGSVIAGATAWFGGNEIATQLANQAVPKVVENTGRSELATLGLVLVYVAIGLAAAVALLWIASKIYEKSAERANRLNVEKVNAAADQNRNTVEFKK